jgi:hypothetical protein
MPEEKIDYSKIDFNKEIPFIRKRCPQLNEEELRKAEEDFWEYVRLVLDIYAELDQNNQPVITDEDRREYQEFLRKLEESTSPVKAQSGLDLLKRRNTLNGRFSLDDLTS